MPWLQKLRLRVLAIAVALGLAALAAVSFAAAPLLPAIGVAAVAVAFAVNTMTARLGQPACYGCGASLKGVPGGVHGVLCPSCGLVNDAPGLAGDPPGSDEPA